MGQSTWQRLLDLTEELNSQRAELVGACRWAAETIDGNAMTDLLPDEESAELRRVVDELRRVVEKCSRPAEAEGEGE